MIEKRRGEISKDVLFMQENAPPYSSDLALSDLSLLETEKKTFERKDILIKFSPQ